MMRGLLYFLFIWCFSIQFTFGQITFESYFSDTSASVLDVVYDYIELDSGIVIFGAKNPSISEYYPMILRIDINGNVVWSTENEVTLQQVNCDDVDIELFSDGFVYGRSREWISPNIYHTLWKVDLNTGDVIWTNNFYLNAYGVYDLVDYDSTRFLLTHEGSKELSVMDKQTGDSLITYNLPYPYSGSYAIEAAVDHNKNVYCTHSKGLYKFNGANLNILHWKREYLGNIPNQDNMAKIDDIYIDAHDDIYLFGRNESDDPVIAKVESVNGDLIWKTDIFSPNMPEGTIVDFVDRFGYLYATFLQNGFGGGTYKYRSVKISKNTGVVSWESHQDVTPLGSPSGTSGGSQSALSLDIDCNGNVYQTGYYGNANIGSEQWGIMKLSPSNGTKLYDLTITNDSLYYDDLSIGMAACVFQNTPVFLGNLEVGSWDTDAMFVTIDPVTGIPVVRKQIGASYQYNSVTKDIQNFNDSLYVLKQEGGKVIVEMYDQNANLSWQNTYEGSLMFRAGQIALNNSSLFVTALSLSYDTIPPYITEQASQLKIYKINKSNGALIDSDSLVLLSDTVQLFELESDTNDAYIFYVRNSEVKALKWNSSGFSSETTIEPSYGNIDYKGNHNLALNYSQDSLLFAGLNAIYLITKSSFLLSNAYTYGGPRFNYEFQYHNGALLLSGTNLSGDQQITSYNPSGFSINWDETYNSGTINGIRSIQNDTLYAFGLKNDSISILKLNESDGSVFWNYTRTNSPSSISNCFDVELYPNWGVMVIAGAEVYSGNNTDAVLSIINTQGIELWDYIAEDELGEESLARTLSLHQDSLIWAGGAINSAAFGREGFIFKILPDDSLTTLDCFGVIGGSAYLDNCNNCVEGNTGLAPCVQDCYGEWGGTAFIDSCSTCAGGNTGIVPILDTAECFNSLTESSLTNVTIHPNPASNYIQINGLGNRAFEVAIYDMRGRLLFEDWNKTIVNVQNFSSGLYIVQINIAELHFIQRVIISRN